VHSQARLIASAQASAAEGVSGGSCSSASGGEPARNYMTRIGSAAIDASELPAEASRPETQTPGEASKLGGVAMEGEEAAAEGGSRPVTLSGTQTDDAPGGVAVEGEEAAKEGVKVNPGVSRPVTLSGTQTDDAPAAAADPIAALAAAAQLPEEELEAAAQLDIAFVEFWTALLHALARGESAPPLAQRPRVAFAGIALPKPHPATSLDDLMRSAEMAREVYRMGAAHAARAKAFFILDGFVTDHFAVLSLESGLLGTLLAFETDPARRIAMHKRRIELLQPPLVELNENAYVQIYRQALYDVASIRSDILELKMSQLQNEPEPRRGKKLAPFLADTIAAHGAFLSRFEVEGKPPTKVDEESAQAYVTSRLSLARAHSKLVTESSLGAALGQYKIISIFLKADSVAGLEGEAKVCDEMIELLPLRITHLKREQAQAAKAS